MSRRPHRPSQKNGMLGVAAFIFVLLLGLTGALVHAPRAISEEIQDLRKGDCFNTADDLKDYDKNDGRIAAPTVDTVHCDEPHKGEVFAVFTLPEGPFPGAKKIVTLATNKCTATTALTDYVGAAELPDTLRIYFYGPHPSAWAFGDRDIACFLGDVRGSSTGSVRASAP
ncbi:MULTISPECIES: septum formation family protein [unclassified Streptomyces]|uniref:septum formation family protein n=1 Tax=unclassified Streptomyces TaxID=2593676 RepID=UPI00202F6379|nr:MULTISPECIES: septum formation family protein [unclassified Streptomyces]MCM1976458.1 septum formation family protein [Streptomyces sp. G1]MCX5129954.1 septum formation family protein [Streptomyces sp. NBC_00347]